MLSTRQLEVLRLMADAHQCEHWDDTEIVCEGLECFWETERISVRTVNALVEHCLVSTDGDGRFRRFEINDTGLAVARRPELADEVWLAVRGGKSFTIRNDHVVEL